MKRLCLLTAIVFAAFAANAGGHGWHGHRGGGTRFSFYWGAPCYSGWYSPGYCYSSYPSYAYSYPSVGYDYAYERPNYAVSGTLGGALIGGLIGNGIHHQGWEGAGIGAAAGLVLGGLAEASARNYERSYYYSTQSVSYSYSTPTTASVQAAPAVNASAVVADPPRAQSTATYRTTSAMSSANALFGR